MLSILIYSTRVRKNLKKIRVFFRFFLVPSKSHSAEKCKRGPLEVFEHPFFYKIEKNEGGPFEDIKKIREKSLTMPKKTCTKKFFGHRRDSNPRPFAWQTSKKPT